MWVLQGHYQSERNFTFDDLAAAKNRLLNYRNFAALRHQTSAPPTISNEAPSPVIARSASDEAIQNKILDALNDNLNTSLALSHLDNSLHQTTPDESLITELDNLFGLNLLGSTPDISDTQKSLILSREELKSKKDYQTADQIRTQLESDNIALLDTPSGTVWQYAS
jgi:cysteinyl-tRNA synthetase